MADPELRVLHTEVKRTVEILTTNEQPSLCLNVMALGGTVAVPVPMDVDLDKALEVHGMRTRQTNQTMLLDAIKRMLGEVGRG